MARALISFLLCLVSFLLPGQTCSHEITGRLLDEEGLPLVGATVEKLGDQDVAITNEQGIFSFTSVCEGKHRITARYIGYKSAEATITVPQDELAKITLKTVATQLTDVVIEGQHQRIGLTQTVGELDKSDLQSLHGKPLGESLKDIPGISAIQTGPAIFKPVIHGLHSQRILILNNGIRQEGQQWGVEHAPEVDPYIASSIQVVKGAETVRYGSDAMGGVIIVNPPKLHDAKQLGGELNVGTMLNSRMGVFSAMIEGSIPDHKDWNWRVQGSLKKSGDFNAANYNLSNTGVEELNFSAAFGFEKERSGLEFYASSFNTEIGILRAAHTGNLGDLQSSIESSRPWYVEDFSYAIDNPKQQIHHHLIKINSFLNVKNLGKITLLYGGQYNQRYEYDIRRGGRSERPALSLNLTSHVLDLSLDHEKGAHSGSVGVTTTIKFNSNDTQSTGIIPLIPDYQQTSAGFFVFEKLKKGSWTLEGGGRYDFQNLLVKTFSNNTTLIKPNFHFHFFSGTLGLSYRISESSRYIANFGLSTRPPHVSELYSEGLHHGTGSIEEGLMRTDGEVKTDQHLINKEMSKKWINTFQLTSKKVSLDFSVYYNAIDNYVFLRPYDTRLTTRGYFAVFRFDQTDALLLGSDLTMNWDVTDLLSYSAKAFYTHAIDRIRNDALIFIPPAQIENGITIKGKDSRKILEPYLTVSVPFTFEQWHAPQVVSPEDISIAPKDQVFDFAPAPAAYALLNIKAGFNIPIHDNSLSLTFSVENALNEEYRNYMNRLRYFAHDTGRNFIVRLSYNFYKH